MRSPCCFCIITFHLINRLIDFHETRHERVEHSGYPNVVLLMISPNVTGTRQILRLEPHWLK
jgi:hypothetical protein